MSMKQTDIVNAIAAELDGAPGIGEVIAGGLSEVSSHLSSSSATVAIEYGGTDPLDQINLRRTGTQQDEQFTVYIDFYWAGPPANWSGKIFDDAYAEAWRRVVDDITFGGTVTGILRVLVNGHDEPDLVTEGDNQHVYMRSRFLFDIRVNALNPEA